MDSITTNPEYEALLPKLSNAEFEALKESIRKNGLYYPIVVNADKTVLDGHHRLRACCELGVTPIFEVCRLFDGNPLAEKQYVIETNFLRRQLTIPQRYLLIAELSKLYENPTGADHKSQQYQDATVASGFDDVLVQTAKVVNESPRTVARARAYAESLEAMPDLKGKPVTWAIKEHSRRIDRMERLNTINNLPTPQNLICGDALTELHNIPNSRVNCIITDPPWGVDYKPISSRHEPVLHDNTNIFPYIKKVAAELYRILETDADLYCFCGYLDSYCNFIEAFNNAGFFISNSIIWVKNIRVGSVDFSKRYAHIYEHILYCKKGNRFLNNKFSTDVLNFPKVVGGIMAVQKPVALLEYLITNSTVKGEIVLDCFCGSGSTLVAAEKTKRQWIGIDIEQKWVDVAKERILRVRENSA